MRFPALLLGLLLALPATAQQQHIAPTEALSPADERKTFKVPDGFEVQLVASEPDIEKPMQIAFDAKGRLWVCTSRLYPFPAEGDTKPTDKLFVLSDFGPDGQAKKVVTFADDLNIPIGVLPLPDCNSVIISEVGRIVKLTDTTGDGRADKRETLYHGFGTRDTHGMTNSFTLMPDGWVYACHGFANESRVKGGDGHEVRMHSGHTFRFRPDGSRIEIYTYGQVNPFGMTVDPWFNLYTADCHSKPITQLIRGAYYDSFGKPHDGLGYGPHVTRHDHGSTALCGLAWYDADHFPEAFKGTMFLGNVVTNRINHDRIEWKGSTPVAVEQPAFLVSSDPWFRPVDIKLGPDGALYVSDFYNRIIGHYEVDLRHPGRDKDRGRIWRIVYKGEQNPRSKAAPPEELADVLRLRELATRSVLTPEVRDEVYAALEKGPRTARAAVDVLTVCTHASAVAPLIDLLLRTPAEDTHLRHAARIALRNSLAAGGWTVAPANNPIIADVALGDGSANSAAYLVDLLAVSKADVDRQFAFAEHAARYGDATTRDKLRVYLAAADNDWGLQHARLLAIHRGLQARRESLAAEEIVVARKLAEQGLNHTDPAVITAALNLIGGLKLTDLEPKARSVASDRTKAESVRVAALAACVAVDPAGSVAVLSNCATDPTGPLVVREQAGQLLAGVNTAAARDAAINVLKAAPYRQAAIIATSLAGSRDGAERLFAAVANGEASPRLLQEQVVLERLRATRVRDLEKRVKELTSGLPSPEARLQELIIARASGFPKAKPDVKAGKKAFATHCAACHQIGGEGGKVGPNLDGIGNRGLDRLLEDILDPNRNVDAAFRATTLDLADGRSLTGLLLREEGAVYILADAEGKEQRIPKDDVEKKTVTAMSPMPVNVAEKIPEDEFYHLLAYLLELRAK
jgi:putative heme-binding domain-containing protein